MGCLCRHAGKVGQRWHARRNDDIYQWVMLRNGLVGRCYASAQQRPPDPQKTRSENCDDEIPQMGDRRETYSVSKFSLFANASAQKK